MMSQFLNQKYVLTLYFVSSFLFLMQSNAVKLGLFSGDLTNPLHLTKFPHHSPVLMNINKKLPLTSPLRKPAKPPPLPKLPLLTRPLLHPPLLPPPILPPLLPPLLPHPLIPPLLPPMLPHLVPRLPLIPHLPLLPHLPPVLPPVLPIPHRLGLSKLTPGLPGSLRRKLALKKALGTDLKPIKVPIKSSILKREWKPDALEKLRELRRKGSLTMAEFLRFKILLL